MKAYYRQQAVLPHYSSYSRQRGSGFGALVAGIGRVALPFVRKFLLPAAKKVGRDLLIDSIPELVDVVSKRKTPKAAAKEALRKTVNRQLGQGGRGRVKYQKTNLKRRRKTRSVIRRRNFPKRSRLNFFSNVKNVK